MHIYIYILHTILYPRYSVIAELTTLFRVWKRKGKKKEIHRHRYYVFSSHSVSKFDRAG